MTVCYRVFILLAASLSLLRADLTINVRNTSDVGRASETTEYYKGNLMRRDFGDGYQVIDFSTGRSFSVDSSKREYYPFDGSKLVKQVVDPSHNIFIEVTSSATGEQRQWFGYIARRYLTTKRSDDEFNGKSSGVRETHIDTWVLDLPLPPHVQGIASPNANYLLAGGLADGVMKIPAVQVTHHGDVPHGLVVWQKSDHYESEVIGLSLAPLEDSLFEAPKGFKEVTSPASEVRPRSWIEQIALEWLHFRVWLENVLFYSRS